MSQTDQPIPSLDKAGHARARDVANALATRLNLGTALHPHAAHIWKASAAQYPTLHLDDVSAIPFLVDIVGVEEYQHRGRLRAGDGDLFATVTSASAGYEEYCRDQLGLGSPEGLIADGGDMRLEVAYACGRGDAFTHLVDRARLAGGLAIHPYMGIEDVWALAHDISDTARVPVHVLAPPPAVTWIANDKRHLTEMVVGTIGESGVTETIVTHTVEELAASLRDLAARHARVALKLLRTASSMGNVVFEAKQILATPPDEFAVDIGAELARMEWSGTEPVLAVAWEETDLSPSTQWWIPPVREGTPQLSGIYEQLLEGETKIFFGSRPSRLQGPVNQGLADQAYPLAVALQELGYVGRCSFDHLVLGDPRGEFTLRVTECNGRWGGTSTPMSLLDRLISGPRPPYRAQDFTDARLVGMTFPELRAQLDGILFDAKTGSGNLVLYNVGPLTKHGKFDVIAIGQTQEQAETLLEEDLPNRLGLK